MFLIYRIFSLSSQETLKSDLTKVVVNKLKSDILGEKMVLPNMDDFPIPYFTHHEGEEEGM